MQRLGGTMGRPRMNRKETKPAPLSCQVTHSMKARAVAAAQHEGVTLSAWLREAVRRELERQAAE